MAIKKVRERVHNGGTTGTEADYDIIHYETSEDLLVGQIQQNGHTGFRVLPGGLVLIWGSIVIQDSGYEVERNIIFPVTVKEPGYPTFGCYDANGPVFVNAANRSTTGFTLKVKAVTPVQGSGTGIGAVRVNYQIICEV